MFVIGITGSLGTGKTTVADMFAKLGAKVIDADRIVHQEIRKTGVCFKPIVKAFGQVVLTKGSIDRKKLADIVFKNERKRRQLERIIHPVVKKRFRAKITQYRRQKEKGVVVDVPLLFESGFDKEVDIAIVVRTNRAKQFARAIQHFNISRAEVIRRIKAQMPLREKIRFADMIIDNNETLMQTRKQVKAIWQRIQQMKKK